MAVALTTREKLEKQLEGMAAERGQYEADWAEIGRLCLPNKVDISSQSTNNSRTRRRANTATHDTAGHIAARRLVNGIATGLTSASRDWFKLSTHDPAKADFQPVKEWLADTQQKIRTLFAKTNYYDMTKLQYADLGTMGIGCVIGLEHPDYIAVWHHQPVGTYYIDVDDGLRVSRLARYIRPTVENLVARVGGDFNKVSPQVRAAYDKGNYQFIAPCVHIIERNVGTDGKRRSKNILKPWRSIMWETGQNDKSILISEKGFDSQPFTAPRWETVGDQVYCETSPGFGALADLRELQLIARRKGRAMDGMVKPPLGAPAGLARTHLSLDPGTINYFDAQSGDVVKPLLNLDPRLLTEIRTDQEWMTRRINELFYADLFMAITEMEGVQPRNQQELAYRNEEKLTQLGPVVDRVNIEKLEGDIDRAYTILKNLGLLAPIPPDLHGEPLQIEFVSILALAQRASDNTNIERTARFVGFLTGIFPEARFKFDAEQAVDEYTAALGTSPSIIRSDDMVAEMKKAQEQQDNTQRMAAMAPAAQQGAEAAKLLSQTQVNPEGTSMLQNILGQ
ncbi:MAG: portal protein [Sphingomicrobium sp.]